MQRDHTDGGFFVSWRFDIRTLDSKKGGSTKRSQAAENAGNIRFFGIDPIDNPDETAHNLRLDFAHVAQLDRVPGYEPGGRRFESFHARHKIEKAQLRLGLFCCTKGQRDSNLRHQNPFDKRRRRAERPQADNPSMRAISNKGSAVSAGPFCRLVGRGGLCV